MFSKIFGGKSEPKNEVTSSEALQKWVLRFTMFRFLNTQRSPIATIVISTSRSPLKPDPNLTSLLFSTSRSTSLAATIGFGRARRCSWRSKSIWRSKSKINWQSSDRMAPKTSGSPCRRSSERSDWISNSAKMTVTSLFYYLISSV